MIECKEALLDNEIESVKKLLLTEDLVLDNDVDLTLYLEDNNKIIGTISKSKSVIKCVCVDKTYQGEDLTGKLVNKIVEKMSEENIFSYQVYTKPKYKMVFESLGFETIVESSDALFLEKGTSTIIDKLEEMKQLMIHNFGKINSGSNIGCITMNANPFTLGHQYLVEEALKNHDYLVIFLVSEDKSIFSYEERHSLAYICTQRFPNVLIIPSSIYMVSSFTFPAYFIHDESVRNSNIAYLDALIFKNYFMKYLYIKKRYVGSETKDYMVNYNNILKEILNDKLVIIPRNQIDDVTVSASNVRMLLEEHKVTEALQYIPQEARALLRLLALQKYGC